MRARSTLQSPLLAMMLLSLAMSAAGTIDWTDDATDIRGDVRDSLGNIASGREDIDILGVRTINAGTDFNVTLVLAGCYNASAKYTVDLLTDGSARYGLTWERTFAAAGPTGATITVSGDISRDGKTLTWSMAKSSVAATSYVRINGAESRLEGPNAIVWSDTAEGTPQYEVQLPKGISVSIVYRQLTLRDTTIIVTYEGANASTIRTELDANADGTVSAAEATAHATEVRQAIARETRLHNITLDGRSASRETYDFELQGTEGSVTGTAPVRFTMTQTMKFPQPDTRGTHAYRFESAIGGDDPWENDPMGDDPWGDEFLGDDEPWENVFYGGVVPWGAQAIGGDEPWDNVVNVVFRLEAPEGWRFAMEDWPAGMADYVNSEGDVLEMDAEATASNYATTIGKMNMLKLEEFGNDEVQLPQDISVRVVYEQLHLRNITITVTYGGANASAVRAALDLDADGTVSPAEATAHATEVRQAIVRETRLHNSTLDGRTVSRETYGFELQGAEGAVTGTAPVRFTIMQTMEFPLPETRGSHVYYFESAIGGDEPWDNEPMGDDPWGDEFLGDDDPWENVFFGGSVPWEAQAIGGDEPWDNVANVVFRVEAPEGWRFDTKDWPAGLADHLNEEGAVLEMDAEATASSYATTVGKMNTLRFEEVSNDEDGGFIPAYGAMLALAATAMTAGLSLVRRGRALRP